MGDNQVMAILLEVISHDLYISTAENLEVLKLHEGLQRSYSRACYSNLVSDC